MMITKRQDYGMLLMIMLAQEWQKNPLPLSKAASFYHLSPFFLKRIALDLKKAHLISSKEGVTGGYRLSRSPKEISLREIMRAFLGNQFFAPSCSAGSCPIKNCRPKTIWQRINKEILKNLEKISLAEIIK